ncbi:MAG: hypothetical protein QOI73_3131 [Solirubrobacteraceae bacterium]|nr:hypothetical protein [Solirubrobacteraceae bacterium]
MKGLLSTTASRAWLGVVVLGAVVVAVVLALGLVGRLTAGQELLDTAEPVVSAGAVTGEVAGTKLLSQYVELADPLVSKGGAAREVPKLIALIARRTGVSPRRARAYLHDRAPHIEALLRSLPFSGVVRERDELTSFLATTLNTTPETVQDQLATNFPHLFQMLAALPSVTGGWRNVPGVEGMTRFDGARVKTLPEYRDYVRDDLVGTVADEQQHVRSLAGKGGIGYIPYLLLVIGLVLIGFGLLHARWSRHHPSGRFAWAAVVAIGVLTLVVVGALSYFPRLNGADTAVDRLAPAFDQQRIAGTRAGVDLVVQTASFGDPIVTAAGGGAREVPQLLAFVAEQTGVSPAQVRRRLRRAAPRTSALLEAIPLSRASAEVAPLLSALARKFKMSEGELLRTLRSQAPKIARALPALRPVTRNWDAIPGTQGLRRTDDGAPVRTLPAFASYLDKDVVPVLERGRGDFESLADPSPELGVLAAVMLAIGVLLAIYATAMMFLATSTPKR